MKDHQHGQKSIRSLPGPAPAPAPDSGRSTSSIIPALLCAKAAHKAHSKPTPVEYTRYLISALHHLACLSAIAFHYCSAHMAQLVVSSLGCMSPWADSAFAFIDLLISPPDVDQACLPASQNYSTWSEPACGTRWLQSFGTNTKATIAFLHNQFPADDSSLTERMLPLEPGTESFFYESLKTHSSSHTNGVSLEVEPKPASSEFSSRDDSRYQNDLSQPDRQSIESFALDFSDESALRKKFKRKTRRRTKKHRKSTDAYSSCSSISSDILQTSTSGSQSTKEGSMQAQENTASIAFHKVEHSPKSCSLQSVDSLFPQNLQLKPHLDLSQTTHTHPPSAPSSSLTGPSLYPYLIARSISLPLQLDYFQTNVNLKHSPQVTASGLAWSVPPHFAQVSA